MEGHGAWLQRDYHVAFSVVILYPAGVVNWLEQRKQPVLVVAVPHVVLKEKYEQAISGQVNGGGQGRNNCNTGNREGGD